MSANGPIPYASGHETNAGLRTRTLVEVVEEQLQPPHIYNDSFLAGEYEL